MLYKKLWLNLWVFAVTTFAVVWIEMQNKGVHITVVFVTTFAVVWIEIGCEHWLVEHVLGHHLRGGVD